MKKTVILMTLVIGTAFFVSGCTTSENKTTTNGPKDCGADITCANELVANCYPGTFTEKADRVTGLVTIIEKSEGLCVLKEEVALSEFGPFAKKEFDANNDGKYSVNCKLPPTKDVATLVATIKKSTEEIANPPEGDAEPVCEGELLEFGNFILQSLSNQ